jgi:hypothetical protein
MGADRESPHARLLDGGESDGAEPSKYEEEEKAYEDGGGNLPVPRTALSSGRSPAAAPFDLG